MTSVDVFITQVFILIIIYVLHFLPDAAFICTIKNFTDIRW